MDLLGVERQTDARADVLFFCSSSFDGWPYILVFDVFDLTHIVIFFRLALGQCSLVEQRVGALEIEIGRGHFEVTCFGVRGIGASGMSGCITAGTLSGSTTAVPRVVQE